MAGVFDGTLLARAFGFLGAMGFLPAGFLTLHRVPRSPPCLLGVSDRSGDLIKEVTWTGSGQY